MNSREVRLRLFAPALLTAANIVVGFLAIVAASEQRFDLSVYLLLLAIFLDMFDGRVARWLKATTKFGQEADSFSDSLSFCAAPAFLVYESILRSLGSVGIALSVLYLLAGIWRLVRFNLTSEIHTKAAHTLGAPTPIAASYMMALVLMRHQIGPVLAGIVVVVMALLMVSRLRLPELSGRGVVAYSLLVGLVNYFAVIIWPNWYTVGWWNLWNALILIIARADERAIEDAEPSI
ncbi:MAG: CDP-diacylglycerol--serine O-phosphatidyltransferase [Acidobacteriota bacterium]